MSAEVFKHAWIDSVKMSGIVKAFHGAGFVPSISLKNLGPSASYTTSVVRSHPIKSSNTKSS